jgi:hypothetical protein
MGAMKPDQRFHKKNNVRLRSIEIGQYLAKTPFKDYIQATHIDLSFSLSNKTHFQFKLPYLFVQGALANTSGLSDISISLTRNIINKESYQFNATIGGKIPTNQANKTSADGRPLPMYYQSSLGTYDAVLGVSLISKKWLFAVGYQQPFNHVKNQFLWAAWRTSPDSAVANLYPRANQLKRGTDLMARIERNFRFSNFNFYVGGLYIYRITPDQFTIRRNDIPTIITDRNSLGAAISLLAGGGYKFSTKSGIKLAIGYRVKRREMHIDGLARDWVTTLAYEMRF